MKLAVVGVGGMGRRFAESFAAAGYEVAAFDTNPEKLVNLESSGIRATKSASEAASDCEYLITSLPGPAQLRAALLTEGRALESMPPGSVLVDLTTTSLASTRELSAACDARQIDYFDCPVSGGPPNSFVMVGGPSVRFEDVRNVLAPVARHVVHVGQVGSGTATKLICQFVAYSCFAITLHGLAIGGLAGIKGSTLIDIFDATIANTGMLPIVRDIESDADLDWYAPADAVAKDLRLADEMVRELDAHSEFLTAIRQQFRDAQISGIGARPFPLIGNLIREQVSRPHQV